MSIGLFPFKVDWNAYEKACPLPEEWEGNSTWLHSVQDNDDRNADDRIFCYAAEAWSFMAQHVGRSLVEPAINILLGLGTNIDGWKSFGEEDPHGDEINYHFGANLKPETVQGILKAFDGMNQQALEAALQEHWPKLLALGREKWWAEDAQFFFPQADKLIQHVRAWRDVYAEAALEGRGILIVAG